jgi:hypothetical protein
VGGGCASLAVPLVGLGNTAVPMTIAIAVLGVAGTFVALVARGRPTL